MIRAPAARLVLRDVHIAGVIAHLVRIRVDEGRRDAVGRLRGILIRRQVRRAQVNAIYIYGVLRVVAVLPGIRDVQRARKWQRHLRSNIPLERRRVIVVVLEHSDRRRRHGRQASR